MFGQAIERKEVLASELKRLEEAGYKIVDRKGKDRGTRVWLIIEKGKRKSIALVVLGRLGEEGWVAKLFHEDLGIPRLNCPISMLTSTGGRSITKKARNWRSKALELMQEFSDRAAQIRLMKKQFPNVPYSVLKKMITEKYGLTISSQESDIEQLSRGA